MLMRFGGMVFLLGVVAPLLPARAADTRFFEEKVRPILQTNCIKCHGGEKTKGGLQLISRNSALKGGEIGSGITPGNPAKSLLIEAIGYKNDKLQMPPTGKLPQAEIDVLTQWVEMGLPWSGDLLVSAAPAASAPHHGPPKVDEAARSFWSFRPVVRPAVPPVRNSAWVT